jgi:hypothetical protein
MSKRKRNALPNMSEEMWRERLLWALRGLREDASALEDRIAEMHEELRQLDLMVGEAQSMLSGTTPLEPERVHRLASIVAKNREYIL